MMTNMEMMEVANRRAHELWEECDMDEYNRVRAIAERCADGNPTDEDLLEVAEMAEEFEERDAEAEREEMAMTHTEWNERMIWNPHMNGGEWEMFEEDMITYEVLTNEEVMRNYMEHIFDEEEVAEMSTEEVMEFMKGEVRVWLNAEYNAEAVDLANRVMGIHEGYRCEQEEVPAEILAWAMANEDGNR